MADYMSFLGQLRRHHWQTPQAYAGIRCHDIGFDERTTHQPRSGGLHWVRRSHGLIIMLDGNGFFESALSPRRELHPGDAVLCAPGLWQDYGPLPDCRWVEWFCMPMAR